MGFLPLRAGVKNMNACEGNVCEGLRMFVMNKSLTDQRTEEGKGRGVDRLRS